MTNFDDIAANLRDSSNPELPSIAFKWRDGNLVISSFKLPCADKVSEEDCIVDSGNVEELMRSVCEAIILHTPFERVLYSISGGREPFRHIPMTLNDNLVTMEDFLKYLVDNTVVREFGDAISYRVMPRLIQVGNIVGLIVRGLFCNKSDWPTNMAEVTRMAHEAQLRAMHSN